MNKPDRAPSNQADEALYLGKTPLPFLGLRPTPNPPKSDMMTMDDGYGYLLFCAWPHDTRFHRTAASAEDAAKAAAEANPGSTVIVMKATKVFRPKSGPIEEIDVN